jgi:hypothetical protein
MILKRILTRKSIIGYGSMDVRDLSVQMLLDLGNHNFLINSYYNLDKIDFIDDILNELGITAEWRIVKPSKDYDKRIEFYKQRLVKMSDDDRLKYFQSKKTQLKSNYTKANFRSFNNFSNNSLRLKNQGKY